MYWIPFYSGYYTFAFLNPYYFNNPYNKHNEDKYYLIAYNDINNYYFNFQYNFNYFNENDAIYVPKLQKKKIKETKGPFDNFIQIDPPNKENSTLILSVSSCYGYATFHILSEFNGHIGSYKNYPYDTFIGYSLPEYINKKQLYIYFESFNNELDFTYDYVPLVKNYSHKYSNLSEEIKVNNTYSGNVKIQFYPFILNEDIKYQLYLVKTNETIKCRCNFDNINSDIKKIINIGIFRIDENSNNKTIETEINLKLGNEEIYGLKLTIFGATVNNFHIENFYKIISFDYFYQKEKKSNSWLFIIILIIIIICGIVICIYKRRKKKININNNIITSNLENNIKVNLNNENIIPTNFNIENIPNEYPINNNPENLDAPCVANIGTKN